MVSYQLSNGTRHTHRSPQMPHVQSTSQHHFPRTKTMPKIILHIWMTKIFSTKSSSWTGTKCHHHFCMTDKCYTGLAVIWCKSELYGSGCIRLAWKKYTKTTLHLNCRSMQVVWQSHFAVLMFYPSCHKEDEQNIPAWAKCMPCSHPWNQWQTSRWFQWDLTPALTVYAMKFLLFVPRSALTSKALQKLLAERVIWRASHLNTFNKCVCFLILMWQ